MRKPKTINVLVSPAGIGDLLCVTPGLKKLRERYPSPNKIKVFVGTEPNREILLNNPHIDGVYLGDPPKPTYKQIRKKFVETLDISLYPATWESARVPDIHRSRIDLFNEAMGNPPLNDKTMVFNLTSEENQWAQDFLQEYQGYLKIVIQSRSSELYKDWALTNFAKLVKLIKAAYSKVVIFCFDNPANFHYVKGTIPVKASLRNRAAIVKRCDVVICPDSIFLHIGGAFNIPTLLILGPSGDRAGYPNVIVTQKTMPCVPCWLNASMHCNPLLGMQRLKEGGFKKPQCLQKMTPEFVFAKFQELMEKKLQRPSIDRSKPKRGKTMRHLGDKIISSQEELSRAVAKERTNGNQIIQSSGCFDPLHIGHIYLFEKAKKLGGIHIVTVNSDDSVTKNKSADRPYMPQKDRAEQVAALESVDFVYIFSETTPHKTIDLIKPDFYIKGKEFDYEGGVPEKGLVEQGGGKVVLIPSGKNCRSTALVSSLRQQRIETYFIPQKESYTQKPPTDDACPFCQIWEHPEDNDAVFVCKGQEMMVIMNLSPATKAHTMILPKRHITDICEYNEAELLELHSLTKKTQTIVRQLYDVAGFNIGYNIGKCGGASIEHLHLHIVPRYNLAGDGRSLAEMVGGYYLFSYNPLTVVRKMREAFKK